MSMIATLSKWETDVLGVKVGRLQVDELPDVALVRMENEGQFDVVFVSCDHWLDPWGEVVAVDHLYDMELPGYVSMGYNKFEVLEASKRSDKLIEIAREALRDSRLLRDPYLAAQSGKRYVRWLAENKAYVPVEAPEGAFLVPMSDPDGAGRISLVAVSKELRGTGVGTRLALGVFAALPQKEAWRVKVAARNYRAIRFYSSLGFQVKEVSTNYHIWMKNSNYWVR
jgi:ribosomal protein S18 acetylase RimI-like enzyme